MAGATMRRGLSWLAGGLVLLAGLLVWTAPELLEADTSAVASVALVAFAAGIPGIVLLVVAIAVRSRRSSTEEPDGQGAPND